MQQPPLGLTLHTTPSFIELVSQVIAGTRAAAGSRSKLKMKASNFPALALQIGSWLYTARREGDILAKCYYAKRKFVWEVFTRGLKHKMEIQWADISALRTTYPESKKQGILIVELHRPPLFFAENDPQPRKHTVWQATSDFTDGQATVCRRHVLQFPAGVLNRHYERLMTYDKRLRSLSQRIDWLPRNSPVASYQPWDWFDCAAHEPGPVPAEKSGSNRDLVHNPRWLLQDVSDNLLRDTATSKSASEQELLGRQQQQQQGFSGLLWTEPV